MVLSIEMFMQSKLMEIKSKIVIKTREQIQQLFSPNFQYFINTYSSATSAPTYTLNDSKRGAVVKTIVSNEAVEQN